MQKSKTKTKAIPAKRKMSVSTKKQTNSEASVVNYFTQDEIVAMMSVLEKQENDELANLINSRNGQKDLRLAKQDRLMFNLGFELGTRVNELVGEQGLSWESFDYERKLVKVWDEKKDKHRMCTIPADSWTEVQNYRNYLKEHFDMRKEVLLFPMSDKTANRRIKAWALAIGVKRNVRWHMLRHTFVVQSRRVGRDWNFLSIQTGDRASTLIEIYGRLSIEDRQQISDQRPLIQKVV
jgi:site-specific recombinase XerD